MIKSVLQSFIFNNKSQNWSSWKNQFLQRQYQEKFLGAKNVGPRRQISLGGGQGEKPAEAVAFWGTWCVKTSKMFALLLFLLSFPLSFFSFSSFLFLFYREGWSSKENVLPMMPDLRIWIFLIKTCSKGSILILILSSDSETNLKNKSLKTQVCIKSSFVRNNIYSLVPQLPHLREYLSILS